MWADGGLARPVGLLAGYVADQLLGDPSRWHPVAGFGRIAQALEKRTYRHSRAAGTAHTVALVGGAVGVGVLADRLTRDRPVARAMATAVATWAVLGGRSLGREASAVSALLGAPDLPRADVFACGPRGFLDKVAEATRVAGVPAERFHDELFVF